jgi:hypothetical protein
MFNNLFSENHAVYEIMRKNMVESKQATYDNIIRHMRSACCITKATDTHTQYVMLFCCNNGYANAPQCYVIRTLPLLLI